MSKETIWSIRGVSPEIRKLVKSEARKNGESIGDFVSRALVKEIGFRNKSQTENIDDNIITLLTKIDKLNDALFKEVRDNNIEINNLLNLINKRFEAFAWRTQYPNDFFALFAFAKSFDIQKLMDDLERRSQKLAEEAKINYDKRYKK